MKPDAPAGRLLNAVGYQAVWITAVSGAGAGLAWPGPLAAVVFAALTLATGGRPMADLRTLALALPIGFTLDSLFAASGWLVYAEGWPGGWAAPLWVWALWTAFAMTLNHSLDFLSGRLALTALLGAVGGPLAYAAAAGAFDAVSFARPFAEVMLVLALAWGAVLPLLVWANHRWTSVRLPTGRPA
jgi:hypothetical protein